MALVKTIVTASAAALTLLTGVAATATPASAWYRGGWGGPVAAGVIGGLAAGALIGSAARPYGYGPVYDDCYRVRRPVYDVYGNFAGYRLARVCN